MNHCEKEHQNESNEADVYYFDVITINTIIPPKALREMQLFKELHPHIGNWIVWTWKKDQKPRRFQGYRCCIQLFQVTDTAVAILQKYDFSEHGVSYLEIAWDRIYSNKLEAKSATKEFTETYFLNWGKRCFNIKGTGYIGKEYGKKRNFYMCCYHPEEGKLHNTIDEETRCLKNTRHTEFRIRGKSNIRHKLGVKTIYDLEAAESSYRTIAEKYLVKKRVKTSLIKKHFPNMTIRIQGVAHLDEFISEEKDRIKTREDQHAVMNCMFSKKLLRKLGVQKEFRLTDRTDKIVDDYGISYWKEKYD